MSMTLAIENPLPHLIGGRPDEFQWMLDHVGAEARVCLDTSHATLGNHWASLIGVVGDRVVHVHANDHHGTADEHLAPGNGTVPWPSIGESLRRVGFDGWLILELNREISASPEQLVRVREQLLSRLG